MHRRSVYTPAPAAPVATLAGAVAIVLATSLIFLTPALGLPLLDIPSAIGGVWSDDPTAAFWTGYAVFFVGGWLVAPLLLKSLWLVLPGRPETVRGAALKGLLAGAALWIPSGLVLGVLEALGGVPEGPEIGFFGAGAGWAGALALLGGHLVYGLALGVTANLGRGLSPIDALGWVDHGAGHHA